jgi:hypothetical protein
MNTDWDVDSEITKYFLDRLEDPSLLNDAVNIMGDLAVPIGGVRKYGSLGIHFCSIKSCERQMEKLKDSIKFPNLRFVECRGTYTVRWGCFFDDSMSNKVRGRLCGYKESVLSE